MVKIGALKKPSNVAVKRRNNGKDKSNRVFKSALMALQKRFLENKIKEAVGRGSFKWNAETKNAIITATNQKSCLYCSEPICSVPRHRRGKCELEDVEFAYKRLNETIEDSKIREAEEKLSKESLKAQKLIDKATAIKSLKQQNEEKFARIKLMRKLVTMILNTKILSK